MESLARREQKKVNWKRWSAVNKDHLQRRWMRRRIEKRAMCLVATIRIRCRRRSIPFDLDRHITEIQERIDCGKCELTGFPFDLGNGQKFNSPSIDRINPKLGYVHGNIRVVCYAINCALGDWGEASLLQIVETWMQSLRPLRRNSSKRAKK